MRNDLCSPKCKDLIGYLFGYVLDLFLKSLLICKTKQQKPLLTTKKRLIVVF